MVRMRTVIAISLLALGLAAAGCKKGGEGAAPAPVAHPNFPGTADGAKALVAALAKPDADPALGKGLRPDPDDYAAVYVGDAAKKAQAGYAGLWASGNFQVKAAKPTQTDSIVLGATTDELKAGSPNFPPSYKTVAEQMKPGITVYFFKLVEPGSKNGTPYDGLVYVNGHWDVFPKPWEILK
jgi:hypothetical protein